MRRSIRKSMRQQTLITSYFVKSPVVIKGYNPNTDTWHCIVCGENMGRTNARQLCCKSYCPWEMVL